MIKKIKKMLEQFDFWFSHHKELQCEHLCVNCKYYTECLNEVYETWCENTGFKIEGRNNGR